MLRLILVVSWKITSLVTGIDTLMTTVEIVVEVVRTARQQKAKSETKAAATPVVTAAGAGSIR